MEQHILTKHIGIFGDSFGVSKKEDAFDGWTACLSNQFDVENYCECGVSEYKILKQLELAELTQFDKIIITHTSPTRLYVEHNPLHQHSEYHKNCDIIFSDIEHGKDEFSTACQMYFKHIFNETYDVDIHNLICQKIDDLTKNYNVIHMTHFDYTGLHAFKNMLNFYDLFLKERGDVNHYTKIGNKQIYNTLSELL